MKIESNPVVTVEELAVSNMFEIQALLKVLVKKGIICEDEILDENWLKILISISTKSFSH